MQAQYRNYPPANNHSPHQNRSPHAPARRGPGPMIPPQHQQQQHHAPHQHQVDSQAREKSKRLAKTPTDKNIPDGVENLVIGDGVEEYRKLREMERKLDSVIMRKRLDLQDSMNRNMQTHRTMRIWISNTAENQPWQQGAMDPEAFDFSSGENATYKVKIEGRLLDEDEPAEEDDKEKEKEKEKDKDGDAMDHGGEDAAAKSRPAPSNKPKKTMLSHFFKSITIDFDRSKHLQPDGFQAIEWKRPDAAVVNTSPDANFDVLEFERKGDENINVVINLVRDDIPERFKLTKALAALIDTEEDDRAGVMMGLWTYIKASNLQEDEDTRKIQCDAKMRAVFQADSVFFPNLPSLIMPHLTPLPPLKLPYTIRVDKAFHSSDSPQPTIYDIPVPLPDPLRTQILALSHSQPYHTSLSHIHYLDTHLAYTIEALTHAKAKHSFYNSFSKEPVGFVKRWMSSQRRDLEVVLGEGVRGGTDGEGLGAGPEWRRGGEQSVWAGQGAKESVGLWLARTK